MLLFVLQLLVAAIVLYGIYGLIRFNVRPAKAPPVYPSLIPYVGHVVSFGVQPLDFMCKVRDESRSPVVTLNMLGNRLTLITDPALHSAFFPHKNEVLSPREVYAFMVPVFGEGVAYGASYSKMREQLNFLSVELSTTKFANYGPAIQAEVRKFVTARWRGASGEINLLHEMSALIINTACQCLFGDDLRKRLDPERFSDLLAKMEASLIPAAVFVPSLGYIPFPAAHERNLARNDLIDMLTKIVEDRQQREAGVHVDTHASDLLNGLMNARYTDGSVMTMHEVCGMIIAAMFAGQHTSTITTTWTLLHLMQPANAAHLKKLRDSYAEADLTANLTYDNVMNEMEFAEACARESIRRDPPLIMLMRKVMTPLACGEFTVPEGDIIACSPLLSHHHPRYFPDPRKWDPTRVYDKDANVAFGAGVHRCLGEKFGLFQVKTILFTLLSEFDFAPCGALPEPDYHTMVVGPKKDQANVKWIRRASASA
jgi:sterol 14-demethylase